MKKAKRLLAMLMAFLMLASGASVSVYAHLADTTYTPTRTQVVNGNYMGDDEKFDFSPEEGASYIVDMLDDLLIDLDLNFTWENLTSGVSVPLINIPNTIKNQTGLSSLNLSTLDDVVNTVYRLLYFVKNGGSGLIGTVIGLLKDTIFGDLTTLSYSALNTNMKHGSRSNSYANGMSDLQVLYMLIQWLYDNREQLQNVVTDTGSDDGHFKWGALKSAIPDMIKNLPGYLKGLLYSKLINDDYSADDIMDALPNNTTIDASVQQLINWALIDGTGETGATGGNSILGSNFKALLPAMGDEPGGANVLTMETYQLVSNALNGALNSIVAPLLSGVICNALGAEATEQYPYGDPAIVTGDLFPIIVGLVKSLCEDNGAPEFVVSDAAAQYPITYVDALMDYFFSNAGGKTRALDTFILVQYSGISLTDNFMSLLYDLARLAVPLLSSLGILKGADTVAIDSDLLNRKYGFDRDTRTVVEYDDETSDDDAYVLFQSDTVVYRAADFDKNDPHYFYASNGQPVDGNSVNLDLIRPKYYVSTDEVFACLLRMVFVNFIDGCYFPEWANSVPAVCAYALASFAATILPENDYFDRLDAYYLSGYKTSGTYTMPKSGNVVTPLPFTASKTYAGSTYTIPKAALDIGASVLAYYTNTYFKLKNHYFTTDTTLEQFGGEFLLWGATTYMPILFGSYDSASGKFTGSGAFVNATNTMINAVYSNWPARKVKTNANWDAAYAFIENTLFTMIPANVIPNQYASTFKLINGWLCENLVNFDLQGILSLLSVNTSANAELKQPLLKVLLRIIDRVLGTVFGRNAVLPDTSRTNVYATATSITSLDALLTKANLAAVVGALLTRLNTYKEGICTTAFPLFLRNFVMPYRTAILGTSLSAYEVDDLERYVQDWQALANSVKINSTPYTTLNAAETAKQEYQQMAAYKDKEIVLQSTRTRDGLNTTTVYDLYAKSSYLESATQSADLYGAGGAEDTIGIYHTYSNFNFATINAATYSNPEVTWSDGFQFARVEDSANGKGALFNNRQDAFKDASKFITSYREYAESTLPSAYGSWLMYFIKMRAYVAGVLDTNDDGKFTEDDGRPGAPSADYPFYANVNTSFPFVDKVTMKNSTIAMNTVNATNFKQLKLAEEYGNNAENNVEFGAGDVETIVRLALNSLAFDITKDDDGNYNAGSKQWETLTAADKTAINTFCNNNGLIYDQANNKIYRKAFAYISNNISFTVTDSDKGNTTVSSTPPTSRTQSENKSAGMKVQDQIFKSYRSYVQTLIQNRQALYNQIDNISYRIERFETNGRGTVINTKVLDWALMKYEDEYLNPGSGRRNQKIVGYDASTDSDILSKIYTQSSYAKFRDAYDYGRSLSNYAKGVGDTAGLTQSMVTYAYRGIIDAYKALVPYTGDADWEQLLQYIAIANQLTANGNPEGDLGYTAESYQDLVDALAAAIAVRNDTTIDCESQNIVDDAASALSSAIIGLVYRSLPALQNGNSDYGVTEAETIVDATGKTVVLGKIFNMQEGTGITLDMVGTGDDAAIKITGMTVLEDVGNKAGVDPSGRGYGTGAQIYLYLANQIVARYTGILYGDVNGDARIDGTDATYALFAANNLAALSDAQLKAVDVNHSGAPDAGDYQLIKAYYNYEGTIDQNYSPEE